MKKIFWIGCAYGATVLLQILAALLFLFLPLNPLTEAVVLAFLLLSAQVCVFFGESELAHADLSERALGLVYWIKKVISALLAAGVLNLLLSALSGFVSVPILVTGLSVLLLVLTCVGGVILLLQAVKQKAGETTEETPEENS